MSPQGIRGAVAQPFETATVEYLSPPLSHTVSVWGYMPHTNRGKQNNFILAEVAQGEWEVQKVEEKLLSLSALSLHWQRAYLPLPLARKS